MPISINYMICVSVKGGKTYEQIMPLKQSL